MWGTKHFWLGRGQRRQRRRSLRLQARVRHKGETSYGAYSPDVPGCVAVGDTREEALQLFREALQGHLELMREEHLPLPEPLTSVEYVDIPLA